jgi:hypothetical protein
MVAKRNFRMLDPRFMKRLEKAREQRFLYQSLAPCAEPYLTAKFKAQRENFVIPVGVQSPIKVKD